MSLLMSLRRYCTCSAQDEVVLSSPTSEAEGEKLGWHVVAFCTVPA